MSTYYVGALFQALEIQGWTNETKAMFSWACILVGERDKKTDVWNKCPVYNCYKEE